MRLEIPRSLKAEHEELHAELKRAARESGEVGEAAMGVATALRPHFLKEEEYALPPLGLLSALAAGSAPADTEAAVEMAGRLKRDLGRMIEEHRTILARLQPLIDAANREGKPEYVRFAENLKLHARMEEEVLYPAAILVGLHLKPKRRSTGREPYLVHD